MKNLFTVIIPVFNAEKYISDCIESLKAQDYSEWQAICVNDGSTDASLELLLNYAKNDSRIKVLSQENKGVSAARNFALDNIVKSRNNWITFLDADDFIAPDMFSQLNNLLSGSENDIQYIRTKCSPITTRKLPEISGNASKNIISRETYFKKGKVGGLIASIIVRSDFLMETGIRLPEDMKVLEDQVFSLRVALRANKIMTIDRPFYFYYQDHTSQGNQNFNADDIIRCINYLWDEFTTLDSKKIQSYFHNIYLPIKIGMLKGNSNHTISLNPDINYSLYLKRYYLKTLKELPYRLFRKVIKLVK